MPVITPPVDAGLAAWLKADALYVAAADASIATTWGTKATETTIISPIALEADADTEAARQLRFFEGPLVADQHIVKGLRHDLIGKLIRVKTRAVQALGYDTAQFVFVIAAAESDTSDTTTLTVLKRLS